MKMMSRALIIAGCLLLGGCAGAQVVEPVKIPVPLMPIISMEYQTALIKAGRELTKMALKHEVEWQGTYQKLLNRIP